MALVDEMPANPTSNARNVNSVMQDIKASNAFQKYNRGDATPETKGNMSDPNGLTRLFNELSRSAHYPHAKGGSSRGGYDIVGNM